MKTRIADLEYQLIEEKWCLRAWKYAITPMLWLTVVLNILGIIYNMCTFDPTLQKCLIIAVDGIFASTALFLILTMGSDMKTSCERMVSETKQRLKEITEKKCKCELREEQEKQERRELGGSK